MSDLSGITRDYARLVNARIEDTLKDFICFPVCDIPKRMRSEINVRTPNVTQYYLDNKPIFYTELKQIDNGLEFVITRN